MDLILISCYLFSLWLHWLYFRFFFKKNIHHKFIICKNRMEIIFHSSNILNCGCFTRLQWKAVRVCEGSNCVTIQVLLLYNSGHNADIVQVSCASPGGLQTCCKAHLCLQEEKLYCLTETYKPAEAPSSLWRGTGKDLHTGQARLISFWWRWGRVRRRQVGHLGAGRICVKGGLGAGWHGVGSRAGIQQDIPQPTSQAVQCNL